MDKGLAFILAIAVLMLMFLSYENGRLDQSTRAERRAVLQREHVPAELMP